MRKIALVAVIAFAAGCGGTSHHAYPADAVSEFTSECVNAGISGGYSSEASSQMCSCFIKKLERSVSYEDYAAFKAAATKDPNTHNAKVEKILASCRPT